ncbi:MAG: ATP/GTP-binding protein [Lachnospiraceae bacterium]
MKLLRVKAKGFKNCTDDFCIDMIAKSKKTSEDKEYELIEIDEGLFVYNTLGVIGKNASGKSSTLELLDWCYDILSTFRLAGKEVNYHGISFEMVFYEEGYLYKYLTDLDNSDSLEDIAVFKNQKLFRKKYYKSNAKKIFDDEWNEYAQLTEIIPEDFSMVFCVLRKTTLREIFYDESMEDPSGFDFTFKLIRVAKVENSLLRKVIKIFDENIEEIKQLDDNNYLLIYQGKEMKLSPNELYHFMSSGTTKGLNLYITAIVSLQMGIDLIVDEIENHFHKTLVENLIMLFKDKNVNKKNATLIFSTHYCELLDLFNRSDNIWITHSREKIEIENMYEKYGLRTELLKSKKFYQNAFDTAVNYEALMNLKRELM